MVHKVFAVEMDGALEVHLYLSKVLAGWHQEASTGAQPSEQTLELEREGGGGKGKHTHRHSHPHRL